MESESEFINRIFGRPAASKKLGEIFVKLFFQTLDAIFSYKRVFFTNVQKANIIAFIKKNYDTHFVCENTPFTFLVFSPLCMPRFVKTFSSPNFWGVKKALCKKFHVFGENWQRNHFPKLTTL